MKVMLHQHKETSSSSYTALGRDKVSSCSKKISEEKSSDNSLDEAPKLVTSMFLLFTTI